MTSPALRELFHPPTARWFADAFAAPTRAQAGAWPPLVRGESTLLLAPTGSGKTLAAFLHALDRLMFAPPPPPAERCRVLYVSPLKALAVDVERNLRAPLAGIARVADASGTPCHLPVVGIRTGDTPQRERAAMRRHPPDILVTTPESLFLLLTSHARDALRSVETVIVDEIHALVPTKRGSHLALSLERLEVLTGRRLQRVGLSATQRPLGEVARFLGGGSGGGDPTALPADFAAAALAASPDPADGNGNSWRPVTIVDAGEPKRLELAVDVPVEDMAQLAAAVAVPSGPAAQGPVRPSIWQAIYPRLLELVQQHRSTLVFVNARRAAERLAAALNELAGETLVYAHHGSLARAQRVEIEDRLKTGRIRGLVATSSLELGIDMGAIDLVVQIEAPPSVASGLQRIGRSGHQVGAASRGVLFPKYRGDLVACAAITRAMHDGAVESTRYPRNPLDVLAQQIVAMVAMDPWPVEALYARLTAAAPFAELPRSSFDGVLDMLSGRYPSDEFAELRPRVTWDRLRGVVTARDGAQRIAITNAGTIPDRGLYAVFLASDDGKVDARHRVGELDEEMVFESKIGETFLLGASTWRIEKITHDRVFVTPAPGEPGKMPFWKADNLTRPIELGQRIGRLVRELAALPATAAIEQLVRRHDFDARAAANLVAYLDEQKETGGLPDERTVVIERCRDELGDWRVCVLSPLGGQVHAPWVMAATAQIRERLGVDVESMWTDDGFVVRMVDTDAPFDPSLLLPAADEVERLLLSQLAGSALFAAKFREIAGRALLLPKRRPGTRAPLWQLRKRAADLLAVAANYGSFPMLLEAYRECLRDVFDLPALGATLTAIARQEIQVVTRTSERPSPFASSLLFGFVANFLYDGDAPLAERRAAALAIDHAQLRELLGELELRELLDAEVIAEVERELQQLTPRLRARSADGLHDLLLRLGDLDKGEIAARVAGPEVAASLDDLLAARRVIPVRLGAATRYLAAEHAAQVRDALGVPLPPGLPEAFLASGRDPLAELLARFARTHGPFSLADLAARYPIAPPTLAAAAQRLVAVGRLVEGAFRPLASIPRAAPLGPTLPAATSPASQPAANREWCAPDVLGQLRRRSLARLRREVEPVPPAVLGRLLQAWQGTSSRRRGLDALLDVIEKLAGAPLAASLLESEILPARIEGYRPTDLDTLVAAGEVVWVGLEPLGERDGRIALFLADQLPILWQPPAPTQDALSAAEQRVLAVLGERGALFFPALREALGGGFPAELLDLLWGLVWKGLIATDSLRPLRAWLAPEPRRGRGGHGGPGGRHRVGGAAELSFRSRRTTPPSAEGRWSLVAPLATANAPATSVLAPGFRPATPIAGSGPSALSTTERAAALAAQLLARYGILARGVVAAEQLPGGFAAVYEVLRRMEEAGRIRRGYFASEVGAMQFALPAALDLLRNLREPAPRAQVVVLAASDPANPYGTLLRWPAAGGPPSSPSAGPAASGARSPTRAVGARVILVDGALAAWLPRGARSLITFLPEDEVDRQRVATALAATLAELAQAGLAGAADGTTGLPNLLLAEIDGRPPAGHPLTEPLLAAGFSASSHGLMMRRPVARPGPLRGFAPPAWLEASPAPVIQAEGEAGVDSARGREPNESTTDDDLDPAAD